MANRFVGYLNRRPYLWFVDLDAKTIESAAAQLRRIPQGVDELVPLDDVVAIRCGPDLFALDLSLVGEPRPLSASETVEARRRSTLLNVLAYNSGRAREAWAVPLPNGRGEVRLEGVQQWGFGASLSPNRQTLALPVSMAPLPPDVPLAEALTRPWDPQPWTVALIDVATGSYRYCDGEFDEAPYPPVWRADGEVVVVGPPYDPRSIFSVDPDVGTLHQTRFRRHAPLPLLDASLLLAGSA